MKRKIHRDKYLDTLCTVYPDFFAATRFDVARKSDQFPTGWLPLLRQAAQRLRKMKCPVVFEAISRDTRGYQPGALHITVSFEDDTPRNRKVYESAQSWLFRNTYVTCQYCGESGETVWLTPPHGNKTDFTLCNRHHQRIENIFQRLAKRRNIIKNLNHAAKAFGWDIAMRNACRFRRSGHQVLAASSAEEDDHKKLPLLGALQVLRLPLELRKIDLYQLDNVRKQLTEEFPWFNKAINVLLSRPEISARMGHEAISLQPTLLVGPPGCGKSRFSRRIAELLNLPGYTISIGGSSDNRALAGTARGWNTARPSDLIFYIAKTQVANPLVLLDEIDKEGTSNLNGRLTDTLHLLIERETASRFYDEFLLESCDLSRVNWLATANDISHMASSLLSRFVIVNIGPPDDLRIGAYIQSVLNDLAEEFDIHPKEFPALTDLEMDYLQQRLHNGTSLRALRKMIETLVYTHLTSPHIFGPLH